MKKHLSQGSEQILTNILTEEEEKVLIKRCEQGDLEARNLLVERNMGLVSSFVFSLIKRNISLKDFQEDLIQEGCIGLIKAANEFDSSYSNRFSTYALWKIRSSVMRSIQNKGRSVRIPVYFHDNYYIYKKTVKKLQQKLFRDPTDQEVAVEMNISIEEVREFQIYFSPVVSLNEPVESEGEIREFQYFLPDKKEFFEEKILEEMERKDVQWLIENSNLSSREIDILKMHYGFYNDEVYTFDQIGKKYGLKKSAINRIDKRVLKKLRSTVNRIK